MSTSETYLNALLSRAPSAPEQELLLSALESGKHPWLAAGLWEHVDTLEPSSLGRYLRPDHVAAAYLVHPEVARSAHVTSHPERTHLQRAMLEALEEETGRADRVGFGAGRDPLGKLQGGLLVEPVQLELLAELHNWHPRSIGESRLAEHERSPEILTRILERASGTRREEAVTGELLAALREVDAREELDTLHRRLLAHPRAVTVLAQKSYLVTRTVLSRHPDGDGVVMKVLEALSGETWTGKYTGLLAQTDPHVRDVVTGALKWGDLERYAPAAALEELQVRVAAHVAEVLAGNPGAQEVLWGLADEWEGSVSGLLTTAVETSRRQVR